MPDSGIVVLTLADLMDRLAADERLSATRRRSRPISFWSATSVSSWWCSACWATSRLRPP